MVPFLPLAVRSSVFLDKLIDVFSACFQDDINELVDREARVDQLIAHVKEQLKKTVSGRRRSIVRPDV